MEINLFDITRISAKWLQSCDLLPLRLMKMKSRMSRKKSPNHQKTTIMNQKSTKQ